ncbi:hypothetical protein C7C56_026970 [Massilia glaciei]|uniref:Solute-binding protein family 3/N-terminal domain-containing protein n=1 Tax=Massilia glaciei TaxID=1524097 RepID=A0A2U2HA11_9BURK|nr:hypothetical protein C7C56_026970 [Massilia glaciei]
MLSALCLLAPAALGGDILTFCYNKDTSYPWITHDRPGLALRLVTLASEKLDRRVILTGMPWQRCLTEVKAGRFRGALAASFKPERLEFGRYPVDAQGRPDRSKRLFNEQYVLVRFKGSGVFWDGKTVQPAGARIATSFQVSIAETLRALGIRVDDGSKGSDATLRKLLLNRSDAAVILQSGALFEFDRNPEYAEKLKMVLPPIEDKSYYILLGHAVEPELAQRIWDAVEHARESPAYAAQKKAFFSGK